MSEVFGRPVGQVADLPGGWQVSDLPHRTQDKDR